jgi:hypothetical protein
MYRSTFGQAGDKDVKEEAEARDFRGDLSFSSPLKEVSSPDKELTYRDVERSHQTML